MSTTNNTRVMTPEQIAAAIADAAQFSNRFDTVGADRRPFIGQDYERRWIRLDRFMTALAMKLDVAAPGAFNQIGDFLADVSYDKDVTPGQEQSK